MMEALMVTIDAAQALRIDLVDEVFPEARYEAELPRLIASMCARSPLTLLRSKAMLREADGSAVPRDNGESLAAFADATQHPDFIEGISAFLGRRPARFGRLSVLPAPASATTGLATIGFCRQ